MSIYSKLISLLISVTAFTNCKSPSNAVLDSETLGNFQDSSYERAKYQVGSEWGSKPVSPNDFATQPALLRAARATAIFGGGTAFYLGTFHGDAVIATNQHVCADLTSCIGRIARFPLLQKEVKVTRPLGSWKVIDLALLVVSVSPNDAEVFESVAANFDFRSDIIPGQLLFTSGFGITLNPSRKLTANQDDDCKVFSKKNEFRLLSDQDEYNPGDFRAWSFSHGCELSHGDSGSAIVDRETGLPIGVNWTIKFPKVPSVQNSALLAKLVGSDDPQVWTLMSYAVPARQIKDHLSKFLAAGLVRPDAVSTLRAILFRTTHRRPQKNSDQWD